MRYSNTLQSTIRIPFASNEDADIAKQVIEVDRELQPDVVKRTLSVEGNELIAYGDICISFLSRQNIDKHLTVPSQH